MNSPKITWTVATCDVDGRAPARKYKTLAAAVARFTEMCGYTPEAAIADQFYERTEAGLPLPAFETMRFLRAVSDYGTVVTIRKVEAS
jgi:hypothetical protein